MKIKRLLTLLILLAFGSPTFAATTYKWIDEKGGFGFTDDFSRVPPEYGDRVSTELMEEAPSAEIAVSAQATPQKITEVKTDSYGLGESYWSERARSWKDQLKEATKNYERVEKKFMESPEVLSQRRYGSKTRIKMNIVELGRLNVERMGYKAQIEEAREKLAKIHNEAEASGADREWFN